MPPATLKEPVPEITPPKVLVPALLKTRAPPFWMEVLPREAVPTPLPTWRVPLVIAVVPVKVLLPVRMVVPLPFWLTVPLDPWMAATVVVSAWLKFSEALPEPREIEEAFRATPVSLPLAVPTLTVPVDPAAPAMLTEEAVTEAPDPMLRLPPATPL